MQENHSVVTLSPCNWQALQGQRGKAEEVSCFVVCLAISVLCWCLGFLCMFMVYCPEDMSHVLPVHDLLVNIFFTTKWLCNSACYTHVCALVGAIMPTHVCTWPMHEHRPKHVCTHRCNCTHTYMHTLASTGPRMYAHIGVIMPARTCTHRHHHACTY